jgi:hypothetical protein
MLCEDLADVLKEQFVFLETDQYFAVRCSLKPLLRL